MPTSPARVGLLLLALLLDSGCGHPLIVRDPAGQPVAGAAVAVKRWQVETWEDIEPTDARGVTLITLITRDVHGTLERGRVSHRGFRTREVPSHVVLNEHPSIVVLSPAPGDR